MEIQGRIWKVVVSNLIKSVPSGWTNGRMDRQTDGRSDGRTDGRTDGRSHRDAWTHLKTFVCTDEIWSNIIKGNQVDFSTNCWPDCVRETDRQRQTKKQTWTNNVRLINRHIADCFSDWSFFVISKSLIAPSSRKWDIYLKFVVWDSNQKPSPTAA